MSVYDEIEIEDMEFDSATQLFTYPCPCGDKFQISLQELADGEEIARCPSCSLIIKVICDEEALMPFNEAVKELICACQYGGFLVHSD